MLEDSPERRTLFNLLRTLYVCHPVRVDIGGTVESIARITPELLYACYHTYYDLRNMALAVAGDFTPEQVLAVADRLLKPAPDTPSPVSLRQPPVAAFQEPEEIAWERVEETMPVAAPPVLPGLQDGPFRQTRRAAVPPPRRRWAPPCCWTCWRANRRPCTSD